MLAASPTPRTTTTTTTTPGTQAGSVSTYSNSPRARAHYDSLRKSSISSSPIVKPCSAHVDAAVVQQPTRNTNTNINTNTNTNIIASSQWSQENPPTSSSVIPTNSDPPISRRSNMVDAGTQYSPPPGYHSPSIAIASKNYPINRSTVTDHVESAIKNTSRPDVAMLSTSPLEEQQTIPNSTKNDRTLTSTGKRNNSTTEEGGRPVIKEAEAVAAVEAQPQHNHQNQNDNTTQHEQGPSKRVRGEEPPIKIMPIKYETCDTRELVILIASMLMELIRYNDAIPLKDGHLTRFHSRAPPGISVLDYLQRITTHATLPPPILLSMVYYIDKLCALYPAFTISSLTVHRFLITSATVASKGLSDSFWTNKTYARVGGVSIKELALLEMEFLVRVQWRIVPKPEILVDYYRSLVERSPGYKLEDAT